MRFPSLFLTAAVLAALLVPSTALAAEAGLNVNGGAGSGTPESYATLSDTGAKWARHFLFFDNIDEAGLRHYDDIVREEDQRGVKTLLVVASAGGQSPANAQEYADFVGRLAKRLKGHLEGVEIWNEEDEALWWKGGPNPAKYVDLLQRSYTAAKAADPQLAVVFGPLTGNNYDFVQQAYAAGAKGYFDVMATHTDLACLVDPPTTFYRDQGRIARFTFLGYREVRATMLANNDDKPIWLTEIGWSAAQHSCEYGMWAGQKLAGVDEASQAQNLLQAFHCLKEDPYVQVAMWFNNRDLVNDGKMPNMYGLQRFDGSRRPAYGAFQDYARNGDRLTGPCGDFGAPTVSILSPQTGAVLGDNDPLAIRATASDKDILRMTFAIKGQPNEIRNFTNGGQPLNLDKGVALTWQGAKKLPYGTFTLVVTAVDKQGNTGSAEMAFRKVNAKTLPAQKTGFPTLRLLGSGRKRTLAGQLKSKLPFAIAGKVKVEWQAKRKGKWKKISGALANANKPFKFTQKLKYTGQWRVRVTYLGKKPFAKSSSKWLTFTVK